MKKISVFILSVLLSLSCLAQYNATYAQLDTSGTDLNRGFTGLIQYFDKSPVQVIAYPNPAGGTSQRVADMYFRMTADEISKGFTGFDAFFNNAISRGQSVGFRIEIADDSYGGNTVSGARMAYPIAWHNAMQAETNPDYIPAGTSVWFPNWNSPSMLASWAAMIHSIADHVNGTTHSGVSYATALAYMDVGGIGNYGEGHRFGAGAGGSWPTGTQWTLASLQSIVNAQITYFPNIPLIGNINFLNANSELPAGFGSWYLTTSNAWGPLGMRWDHACDKGTFDYEFTNKNITENGVNFKLEEGRRWMTAPVLGEPQQFKFQIAGQCDYAHVWIEAYTYHASTIENADNIENIGGGGGPVPACTADLFRSIAKFMGYRYTFKTLNMPDSLISNGVMTLKTNFVNIGVAPTYELWDTYYELRQGAAVKWTGTSTLQFKGFLPSSIVQTDNFTLPAGLSGTYDLYLIVRHRKRYRVPLYMQVTGAAARQTDGSYLLRSGIAVATQGTGGNPPPPPPPNNPPVVFAGYNQTDTLPKNVDTLQGIVSDADGNALILSWTQLPGGPNTATMSASTAAENHISNLIEGTYTFRLTANDGKGGITSDDVIVWVYDTATGTTTPPPPPPKVYRPPIITALPSDSTVTWPADSARLRTFIARQDTTILSYKWTSLSPGAATTIVSSTSANTKVTVLAQGLYQYRLHVIDNAGNEVDSYLKIRFGPPPVLPLPKPNNRARIFGHWRRH